MSSILRAQTFSKMPTALRNQQTMLQEVKKKRLETLRFKPKGERVVNFVRSFDFYGESVQLTYQGDSSFKTLVGAIISIMLVTLLTLYGGNLLRVLLLKSQTEVSTGMQVLDLDSEEPFRPQELGFDFAFQIMGGDLEPEYGYFTARKFEYVYLDEVDEDGKNIRVVNKNNIPFEKCSDKYFNYDDQEQVVLYGIDNFFCTTDKNYTLAGDFYSNYFSFVEIAVWKCQNDTSSNSSSVVCRPQEEIDSYFDGRIFNLAFVNSIFSMNNYERPLQYYIDDTLFFYMEAQRLKSANLYVMKSDLELEDSMIQFGQQQEIEYYQVQNLRYYDNTVNQRQKIIEVYLRFDKHYELTQRQIYGILQLLGDIGGLWSCLFVIGLIFVAFFQRRLFVSAIIKDIYQVRQRMIEIKDTLTSAQLTSTSIIENIMKKYNQTSPLNIKKLSTQRNIGQSNQAFNRTEKQRLTLFDKSVTPSNKRSTLTIDKIQDDSSQQNTVKSRKSEIFPVKSKGFFEQLMESPAVKFQKLQQKLKGQNELKSYNINQVTREIITRKRFQYKSSHIIQYITQCLCCRNLGRQRHKPSVKNHFYYEKAQYKLQKELDVVNLLRTMRNMKLVQQVILSQRHRMLLRFQRKHVVETDTTSSSDSDDEQFDTLKLMENSNPMVRLMIYGKIKRMMRWYLGKQLDKEDKNLLRGIFKKKLKDFDEDFNEKNHNKSLMQRLKSELVQFASKDSDDSNAPELAQLQVQETPASQYLGSKAMPSSIPQEIKIINKTVVKDCNFTSLTNQNKFVSRKKQNQNENLSDSFFRSVEQLVQGTTEGLHANEDQQLFNDYEQSDQLTQRIQIFEPDGTNRAVLASRRQNTGLEEKEKIDWS